MKVIEEKDIKKGARFVLSDFAGCPFPVKPYTIKVAALKNGWVQYRFLTSWVKYCLKMEDIIKLYRIEGEE